MSATSAGRMLVEVFANRILAIVNEQQAALVRTAFSTVLRESEDLACGIFDSIGRMVAQSTTGTPGHINAMATGMRHFLDVYRLEDLVPGDVLVTNDPWLTSGQLNDLTVTTPVFFGEHVVAFFANTCHAPDIGGRVLSAAARDTFEEGLRIPIMKLCNAGEMNRDLVAMLRANVRMPDETLGDLHAQISCNDVAAASLCNFMTDAGVEKIDALADEVIRRSEDAMREAILRVPDGEYIAEGWSDGFEEPIKLVAAVRVTGDELEVDYAGSSPQSPNGINLVLNYTHAYTSFATKAALAPDVPHNDGSFRPVFVRAPEGCVLNCLEPAPVGSRHLIGQLLPGVVFSALAPALPGRLMAPGHDATWLSIWQGTREGRPFSLTIFQSGGTGGRATKDGLNATGFPSGVAGTPVEVVETLTPLVQQRRELRTDSGGPGRRRGGLGQICDMAVRDVSNWQLSALVDRIDCVPGGIDGGHAGARGQMGLVTGERVAAKRLVELPLEGVVRFALPGGAGYGDPYAREPCLVLDDVVNGYVSVEAAERDYGVVVRYVGPAGAPVQLPEHFAIDEDATAAQRSKR